MYSLVSYPLVCNYYHLEAILSDTGMTKICAVVDATGRRYVAKITSVIEIEGYGSFKDEFDVFCSLTNGQISFGYWTNGQTPLGFPNVYFAGMHNPEFNVIVMDMLSHDLFKYCLQQNLSVSACQRLGCQMLDRLKELHRHGFVHRDVKPSNFMMDNCGTVHLIDFGVAARFIDARTNAHLPARRERLAVGTLMYSSINAQNMVTQSRRDDLESLGYSLIHMIKRTLPWEELHNSGGATATQVMREKEKTTLTSLCRGLPMGLCQYMTTVSMLDYTECPDYNNLREMLSAGQR